MSPRPVTALTGWWLGGPGCDRCDLRDAPRDPRDGDAYRSPCGHDYVFHEARPRPVRHHFTSRVVFEVGDEMERAVADILEAIEEQDRG